MVAIIYTRFPLAVSLELTEDHGTFPQCSPQCSGHSISVDVVYSPQHYQVHTRYYYWPTCPHPATKTRLLRSVL